LNFNYLVILMINFELLYLIYFYIDDYDTACNFWILNKNFTKNYMNIYNKNYEYKFKLLTNNFDLKLKQLRPKLNDECNNELVEIKQNSNLKSLKLCYNLYKKFLIQHFIICKFDYLRNCSWCHILVFGIFHEGTELLDKICKVKFNKNKILFECKLKKKELMEILAYSSTPNVYYIKKYKDIIENAFN
jgi:hypothetical protein